jgi:hypothetical protein
MSDNIGELPEVTVTAPRPSQVAIPNVAPTNQAPYAVRAINVIFQLGQGSFGNSGQIMMTLTGLRVIAQITKAALPTTGPATIRIFGLTPDQINQLSKCGLVWKAYNNYVALQAGDSMSGMATVFNGMISQAYPEFTPQGQSSFVIIAYSAGVIQLKPVPPNSYPGSVPVSQVFQTLAQQAGFTFKDGGVSAVLASPYFSGTIWQQMNSATKAANCFSYLDRSTMTLSAWEKTGSMPGSPTVISAQNGMIGYPTFEQTRIHIRTLFNPSITPQAPGNQIQVISNLTPTIPLAAANGNWTISTIDYNLASQMPGGPWEMTITASPANLGGT